MHPFLAPDFYVRWTSLVPSAVIPDIEAALAKAKAAMEGVCAQDLSGVTYESTFAAMEQATEELGMGWGRLNHLDSVSDSPEQREALNAMLPAVTEFLASIPLNGRLWQVLKTYGESDAVAGLDPIQQRHVTETLADFRQAGADLPEIEKQRVAEIEAELSKLTKQYAEHVLDSTNAWELVVTDEAELAGLPESAIAAAAANAAAKGHGVDGKPAWRFTLHAPSMIPVMQYAESDQLRKAVWQASGEVGAKGECDNSELVWKILALRDEKAKVLGKDHFADLTLQRRMAKTGKAALSFVETLHQRVVARFKEEVAGLAAYKAEKTGAAVEPLEPWEVSYWAERQRKDHYDLDDEALRPYFPVTGVMAGMFEIASKLFGIQIRELPVGQVEVWHPEVSVYEIHDSVSGEHLGSFYADWHPRESKRGGAWMNSLWVGELGQPHLGLIVGNMTPPVGDVPALLTHQEVETIFHEFGHLLHGLLSRVPVKSLSGTNVAWDFVELPSQLMENFCWNRESLDRFAKHYQTGEPIPDALFERMIAAKNFMSATGFMRQLSFGKLDLEMHMHGTQWLGQNLDAVDRQILAEYRAGLKTETPTMLRRFNHLFSDPTGYAAGYYSYKWAEVLDADAFTRFEKEGILNGEVGMAFREHILSKGNSVPADELYRRFMGRDPDAEALLVRAGLA